MTVPPPPQPSSPSNPGHRPLGSSYLLDERIGHGAQGEVWKAHRTSDPMRAPLAVKLLRAELLEDPGVVERFIRERSTLLRVRSPFVVGVRDMVVEGNSFAIVMDYVGGGDLRTYLRSHGPIAPEQAAFVMADIAEGLSAVHEAGIVHRDLKPANVLLDESASAPPTAVPPFGDGAPLPPAAGEGWDAASTQVLTSSDTGASLVPRLADFGVARICDSVASSHTTAAIGTPLYMAPEIFSVSSPTTAVDIYSLGVVLYEVLCGVPPFVGAAAQLLTLHTQRDPGRPAGIPDPLWQLIGEMMSKTPGARPSAAQVARRLRELAPGMAGVPAAARAFSPPPSTPSAVPFALGLDDPTAATAAMTDYGDANPSPYAIAWPPPPSAPVGEGGPPAPTPVPPAGPGPYNPSGSAGAPSPSQPAADLSAQAAPTVTPLDLTARPKRSRRALVLSTVAAVLVVAVAIGGWYWWSNRSRLPVLALANLPAAGEVTEMQRIPDAETVRVSPNGQLLLVETLTTWSLYDLARSSQAPVWSGECGDTARFWTDTQILCSDYDEDESTLVTRSGAVEAIPGPSDHNLQATTGSLAIVIDDETSGSLIALDAQGEEVWRAYGGYTIAWASADFIKAYDNDADQMRVLSVADGSVLASMSLSSEPEKDDPLPGNIGIDVGPHAFYTLEGGTWTVYDSTGRAKGTVESTVGPTGWRASTDLQPEELIELISAVPQDGRSVAVRGVDRTVIATLDTGACTLTLDSGATAQVPAPTAGESCVALPLAVAGDDKVLVVATGEPSFLPSATGAKVVAYSLEDGSVSWQVPGVYRSAIAPSERGDAKGVLRLLTLSGARSDLDAVVSAVVPS